MPDYEQMLENFYRATLRAGDVVVDAGAHIGRHTVPMARSVGPSGKVHAFEPLPGAREQLTQVVAPFSAVSVYPFALGERDEPAEFVVAVDLPAYSGLKTRIYDKPTRLEHIPVEVRALDGLFPDAERLDYIKIDAEGGELGILRGAQSLLVRFQPLVSFEFGENSLGSYGITVDDMAAFWQGKPYALFDITGRCLDAESFRQSARRQEVWDYVAIPGGRVDAVRAGWETR